MSGRLQVGVDPRIELVSVVYYLAGAPEYQFPPNTPYRRLVQEHFESARDHLAVHTAALLRCDHGISHDAPLGLVVYLDRVRLSPIVAMDLADLDPRWSGLDVGAFLEQLRCFAVDTDFASFLVSQAAYMSAVEDRISSAVTVLDLRRWFLSFLGPTSVAFVVIPKLLAYTWSYDVHAHTPSGRDQAYIVLELEAPDELGLPRPGAVTRSLLVHEMCHGYVNPVVESEFAAIAEPSSRLFQLVSAEMALQAYTTPEIMVKESLVRALVVIYLRTRISESAAHEAIEAEVALQFAWMTRLVDLLVPLAVRAGETQLPADLVGIVHALGPFLANEADLFEQSAAQSG